mmetsp:Transcript_28711/g.44107  ORF Transcript_28711/g.44107 Transcript_28711/m.44107 type:complete len:377 (+) Transcript_28711:122-1252(+)|eukprot:CAMPEP_0118681424 /NCGR_PEP_ID=MMETSP0800-20121206/4932_1 /TAXON_ID=210618 ORGANISM="Striatella unipunctata, Strain CCMP2910" /NCGR_SAMPLE_ID=MMETSP0800 /ASSEMBLY_ACC=CAM_ASM_000638 /LENGTH=376 /DNA_ID=CAMNT_0006577721 /DNA_START=42 /DNA_END=1172 /DNA_ORIENTATION=+
MPDNPGFQTTPGVVAIVTGSSGFVGSRLVEMLLDRGAAKVLCVDIGEPNAVLQERFAKYPKDKIAVFSKSAGDLTKKEAITEIFKSEPKIDILYHIAALVGPYHSKNMYWKVNYQGTLNLLEACKTFNVPKFVFSSSPSTRFHGVGIAGKREDEMSIPKKGKFVEVYAETKAAAEVAIRKANNPPSLMTVAVAPHQVYGPYDELFLPNFLRAAGDGKLRIFGAGENKISICHNDNYCHGLICAADVMKPENDKVLSNFYIVTDGEPVNVWQLVNEAVVKMGFVDLNSKFHLPVWLLYGIAYILDAIGKLMNHKFKLTPFAVQMMVIDRYFSIENAKRDLKYEPITATKEAYAETCEWMKQNWLPKYQAELEDNKKK